MRKYIIVVFVLLALVVAFVCYYSYCPCYRPAVKQTGLSVLHHDDDTIRIAYIGDSWAYNHKEMKCVIDSMIHAQIGKQVQIRNVGVCGLTSKEIYNGLFSNMEFKSILEWGPDFCFVSAGINDSNIKNGSDNYKENMRLLISLLLDNHITPVILEIPYYDIYYTFWRMSFVTLYTSIRSMLYTKLPINCIDSYSNAYNELIIEQQWQDVVITIRRSDWNSNGYKGQKELYTADRLHLNQDGYFVLDSCIASQIMTFLKHRKIKN
jgi:lysophospholipase L1-like esterase